MPRDKYIFLAQGAVVAYVLYKVSTKIYDHLKAKDRLKCKTIHFRFFSTRFVFSILVIKLLYKDNVD